MNRKGSDSAPFKVVVQRVGGWKALLYLVPIALITVVLAGVFMAIMSSVLIVGGVIIGARLWWLRRKLDKQAGPKTIDGEFVVLDRQIRRSHNDLTD